MKLLLILAISFSFCRATVFTVTQSTVATQNQKIVSPGDTLLLSGVIGSPVLVTANGTASNPVTIKFADNARLSAPVWPISGAINTTQKNFIVIDGGTNGVIENTANGSGLKNQKPSAGICITGSSNVEIKNLLIQNIYVHVSGSDVTDLDGCGSIYAQGLGSSVSIHDNTIKNDHWLVNLQVPYSNATNLSIANNDLSFCDHGIAMGVSNVTAASASITGNRIHDYANWDTPNGRYHHDGIHIFTENGNVKTLRITGNSFGGATGSAMTSHVYLEADSSTGGFDDLQVTGNILSPPTDNFGNFGAIAIGGAGSVTNALIQKNSISGNKVNGSYGVLISGATNSAAVNGNDLTNNGSGIFFYSAAPKVVIGQNNYTGNGSYGIMGEVTYTDLAAWQKATGQSMIVVPPPVVVPLANPKITATVISSDGKSITILFDQSINKP